MRVHVVTLAFSPSLGGFDERPLADFVHDKEVLDVREHFFTVHDLPYLACLIRYQPGPLPPERGEDNGGARGRRSGPPPELLELPEELRPLFQTLREWRGARAKKDGVPPYVVLTNCELGVAAFYFAQGGRLPPANGLGGIGRTAVLPTT